MRNAEHLFCCLSTCHSSLCFQILISCFHFCFSSVTQIYHMMIWPWTYLPNGSQTTLAKEELSRNEMELMVPVEIWVVLTVKWSQRTRPLCTNTIRILAYLRLVPGLKDSRIQWKRERGHQTHTRPQAWWTQASTHPQQSRGSSSDFSGRLVPL